MFTMDEYIDEVNSYVTDSLDYPQVGDSVDWYWNGGGIVFESPSYGRVTTHIKYSEKYNAPKASFSVWESDADATELTAILNAYFPGCQVEAVDGAAAAYGSLDIAPEQFAECITSCILFGMLNY